MQRQESEVDPSIDALIERVSDIKNAIVQMLNKLENEFDMINWPTFLDNFALLSSHLTAIRKLLSKSKMHSLQDLAVLPLKLSQQHDEKLMQLTGNRIRAFTHDDVPNYLRTRPDPEVDKRHQEMETNVSELSQEEIQKQVAEFTKMIDHVLDIVHEARETWGFEETVPSSTHTTSSADTQLLASAVGVGRGLRGSVTATRISSLLARRGINNSQNSGAGSTRELNIGHQQEKEKRQYLECYDVTNYKSKYGRF